MESRIDPAAIYHPILFYDDDCAVCSRTVAFVLRHDRKGVFRFAALGSKVGRELLAAHAVDPTVDSVVLLEEGRVRLRSDAVLGILRRLGGWWHLPMVLALIPRPLRDLWYDAIARRRTRIGRHLGWSCYVPTDQERQQFILEVGQTVYSREPSHDSDRQNG